MRLLLHTGLAGNIQHPPIQVSHRDEASGTTEQPPSVGSFEGKSADEICSLPPSQKLINDQSNKEVVFLTISPTPCVQNYVLKEEQQCTSEDQQSDEEVIVPTILLPPRVENYVLKEEQRFSSEDKQFDDEYIDQYIRVKDGTFVYSGQTVW